MLARLWMVLYPPLDEAILMMVDLRFFILLVLSLKLDWFSRVFVIIIRLKQIINNHHLRSQQGSYFSHVYKMNNNQYASAYFFLISLRLLLNSG